MVHAWQWYCAVCKHCTTSRISDFCNGTVQCVFASIVLLPMILLLVVILVVLLVIQIVVPKVVLLVVLQVALLVLLLVVLLVALCKNCVVSHVVCLPPAFHIFSDINPFSISLSTLGILFFWATNCMQIL